MESAGYEGCFDMKFTEYIKDIWVKLICELKF